MNSSRHHYAILDYSNLFREIVGTCTRIYFWVPVQNIKQIQFDYNCGINIADLENISWFSLLNLARPQLPRPCQPHKNDVDTLNWIPRKHTKVDP